MLIDTYKNQLHLLKELGCNVPENYICPFCLQTFEDIKLLSLEDAPQEKLGGSKIALTCKNCNNSFGTTIDCHLINFITQAEDKKFPNGLNRPFNFIDPATMQKFRGILRTKNEQMEIVLTPNNNDPKVLDKEWDELKDSKLLYAEMVTNPNKRIPQNIAAALLKNAYVILFSYFGYTFILNPFYDRIRSQMNNPSEQIIPEGLIAKEGMFGSLKDGVYVCDETPLRGFFVTFTLKKRENHNYAVFIPSISNGYEQAIERLREIGKGDIVKLYPVVKSNSFWNNKERIQKLIEWATSIDVPWD